MRENQQILSIELIEIDLSMNDYRWQAFKSLLERKLSELSVVGQEGIKVWQQIRKKIEETKHENSLSLKEFYKLAKKEGIQSEEDTSLMLDYFHKIGVVIYFPDDRSLENEVFLNPNWITRAIYDVLSDENNGHTTGQFDKGWMFSFWQKKGYNQYDLGKLLNLMQKDKFDICYQLPNYSNKYIVPILLPNKTPDYSWNNTKNLQLRYVYEQFMPKGILSQFIVKAHNMIEDEKALQLVWKKGVILKRKNAKAEVIEHNNGREIWIRLQGDNKIELRGIIMSQLDSIISRFSIQPEIKIPCNCRICSDLEVPHFFLYSNLMERIIKKIPTAGECENSYLTIKVTDIIDDFDIPIGEREKTVRDYLSSNKADKFISQFHTLVTNQYPARFFKNANESTYHALIFDWLKQFASTKHYDIQMEVNSSKGEIDLLVKTLPNAKVVIPISDIFEFKYILNCWYKICFVFFLF